MQVAWVGGRSRETATALAALHNGTSVVFAGEAGTGKTHLARALAAAFAGHRVEQVAGTHTLSSIPFGAFARLIDGDPPQPQVALLRGLTRRLGGRDGEPAPLLVVDDAHLLDDGSASVVHQLAISRTSRLILTMRSDAACPDAVTRVWRDGGAQLITVAPLGVEQLAEMLGDLLAGPVDPYTVGRLARLTGGNALAVTEIVSAARADGTLGTVHGVWRWQGPLRRSSGVERLLADRIAAVTTAERDALLLVALAEPLETDVLTDLAEPALVEAMTERGLLTASSAGDTVSLPHPLYGEVLRGSASAVTLRRLRRALAARLDRPEDVLRRVSLTVAAADTPPEADLVDAARQAVARIDGELGERLARMLPSGHPERTALLAGALSLQRRHDEVESLLAAATEAEPERLDLIGARVTNLVRGLRRTDRAVGFLAALAERPGLAGSPTLALLRLYEATLRRRYADAAAACSADPHLSGVSVGGPAGWAIYQLAGAYFQLGRMDDAIALLTAHTRPDLSGDIGIALRFGTVGALLGAGRPDDAEALAQMLLREGVDDELPDAVCSGQAALGEIAAYRGDLRGAAMALRQALALDQAPGTVRHWMLCRSAIAEAGTGSIGPARARLDEAARFAAGSSAAYLDEDHAYASAHVLACAGELTSAAGLLTSLIDGHLAHDAVWPALEAAQLLARIGHHRTAVSIVDRLPAGGPLAKAHITLVRGLARDSAPALLEASAFYEELGAIGLAVEAADAASSTASPGGSRSAAAAARTRDRLAGAVEVTRMPWSRGGERVRLSLREREIAQLAAAGRSNAEIAEQLVLSVRTVENHLHAVYAKLGVTGRGELATAL